MAVSFILGALLLRLCLGEMDVLMIDVPAMSKRCLGEQFPDGSLGKWSFQIREHHASGSRPDKVRVTVKDPKKVLIYSAILTLEKSEFDFTTKIPGLHKACVENRHDKPQRVEFSVSQVTHVKEYHSSHVDKVFQPISKQLDDAMGMLKDISTEMDMSLSREEKEREAASESEGRMATMGYLSIGILVSLACWQVIYLRSFFRAKKLL